MPVIITTVLPPQATLERVLAIESQVPQDYPDTFISHAVTYDESIERVRIVDLWETEEARDEYFVASVLPVIRREAAKAGTDSPGPESYHVSEVAVLSTGAGARTT
jgi:hypothetical protein